MASAFTTLIVVRHGETDWNSQQRFQGHGDSPLTLDGRKGASALGQRLVSMNFDRLISSDLGRAMETATIIAEHTGHVVESDTRLRERHYGVLEGLTIAQIKASYLTVFEHIRKGDPEYIIPSGESHQQQFDRNIGFFENFVRENPGRTAVLVAHGGLLDSLFRFVAKLPLDQPRCFITPNASLSIACHGPFPYSAPWVIRTWGDVAHLT